MSLLFRLWLNCKHTLKALSGYRLRFVFSVLSVALGVSAISVIIGGTDGANRKVNEIFQMFGPDALMIVPGGAHQGVRVRTHTLTWKDVNDIKTHIPGVYEVVPMHFTTGVVKYRNRQWQTFIVGSTPQYFSTWSWYPQSGVIFDKQAVKNKRAVCLLGSKVKAELFPNENPLGKSIILGHLALKVIGVMSPRGGAVGRKFIDDRIIVPITTLMRRILNEDRFVAVLRIRTHADLKTTEENIRQLLRHNHHLGSLAEDDFEIFTSAEVRKILMVISGTLVLFLGTAGLIALIVGGFILANLTYLSITQRQQEIGIRRAYGAKRKDIIFLFMAEMVMTTILGGIAGLGLSWLGGLCLEKFGNIPMCFSFKMCVIALVLSITVGLVFGWRPALNAASVDPITAMKR